MSSAAAQLAQLQSLLASTADSNKPLFEFKAGMLELKTGTNGVKTLTADKRRGKVQLVLEADQILHFQWLLRPSDSVELNLMVFPATATFERVPDCNDGRVYVLKYKDSNSRRFFWLQEPIIDTKADNTNNTNKPLTDAEIEKRVNELINNPNAAATNTAASPTTATGSASDSASIAAAAASAAVGSLTPANAMSDSSYITPPSNRTAAITATPTTAPIPAVSSTTTGGAGAAAAASATSGRDALLRILQQYQPQNAATPARANTTAPASAASSNNSNSASALAASLTALAAQYAAAQQQQQNENNLIEILDAERILPILESEPELLQSLLTHLPTEQQCNGSTEIRSTLRSPQLRQTLNRMEEVLNSSQFISLLQSLSLQPVANSNIGVSAFIQAIEQQVKQEAEQKAKQQSSAGQNK